jgi:tetratricopeptide (TPR) repeat protein
MRVERDSGQGGQVNQFMRLIAIAAVAMSLVSSGMGLPGLPEGPGFGTPKTKVYLQRKLPALVRLNGGTFRVKVSGRENHVDLSRDLGAQLETELMKDDFHFRADEMNPSIVISCQITDYSHPQPTVTQRPNLAAGKNGSKTLPYLRVTGSLSVAFQARTGNQTLASNNITAKYDEEFDSAGNDASHGVLGTMSSAWHRMTGGASSEDLNPPTEPELRSKLLTEAVHQIAQHLVNTNETVEVYLAKGKKALDEGDKQAEAGLWQRALETYETAPPMPKPVEDAYRLYDIGVAYEALAYAAEDEKSAMRFLDEAAINYGKAIDAKPAEKYFLEPQKRIETAIAHYKELEEQRHPKVVVESAPATKVDASSKATTAKALTNAQVIAMVKSGMEDDTVAQAIRVAKTSNFDLTAGGQQQLTSSGVSTRVVAAMKARAARKAVAAK